MRGASAAAPRRASASRAEASPSRLLSHRSAASSRTTRSPSRSSSTYGGPTTPRARLTAPRENAAPRIHRMHHACSPALRAPHLRAAPRRGHRRAAALRQLPQRRRQRQLKRKRALRRSARPHLEGRSQTSRSSQTRRGRQGATPPTPSASPPTARLPPPALRHRRRRAAPLRSA